MVYIEDAVEPDSDGAGAVFKKVFAVDMTMFLIYFITFFERA